MHFYRSFNPIKALTFDLDDTLYDNTPFMAKAEAALMDVLQQYEPLQHIQLSDFNRVKQHVLIDEPDIYHDVLIWRAAAIRRFLMLNGITDNHKLEQITDLAMDEFVVWRNKITVPSESLNTLNALAQKFPLAVITNGNADIAKIGLEQYFQFSLRGGADGLSKPYHDMFTLASDRLNIPLNHILHVGDNLYADVQGAINSGMQACWINEFDIDLYQQRLARVVPHIEITQLSELNNLL